VLLIMLAFDPLLRGKGGRQPRLEVQPSALNVLENVRQALLKTGEGV
jgi:hypothetical protein